PTRPRSGACVWSRWTRAIPARPARAVAFSIAPTAVHKRSFTAACAAFDATRTSTPPATSATNTSPVSVEPSLAGRCQTAHRLSPSPGWRQAPGFSRGVSEEPEHVVSGQAVALGVLLYRGGLQPAVYSWIDQQLEDELRSTLVP